MASGLTDKGVQEYGGKTLDEHSQRTIDHEIDVSRFHMVVREFSAAHKVPHTWQQDRLKLKRGIHPDAYFTVGANHFFLEIERQRMIGKNGRPAVITKLERYFDYYDTAECENAWGFRRYRIVVVVQTEERRTNLLAALGTDLRHRMFWIASEENDCKDFKTPKGDTFTFSDV